MLVWWLLEAGEGDPRGPLGCWSCSDYWFGCWSQMCEHFGKLPLVYANAYLNIHVYVNTKTKKNDGHYQSLLDQIPGLLTKFFHCSPRPSNLSEFHLKKKKKVGWISSPFKFSLKFSCVWIRHNFYSFFLHNSSHC